VMAAVIQAGGNLYCSCPKIGLGTGIHRKLRTSEEFRTCDLDVLQTGVCPGACPLGPQRNNLTLPPPIKPRTKNNSS
jgi:hypothetical protein